MLLIIFSGLPGSGKSTLATALAAKLKATYLRIDTIEQALHEVCDVSQIDGKGYELAHRMARDNLRLGNVVIADSVNPWELTRNDWNRVAEELGVPYLNVEVVCSDRAQHQRQLEERGASPGVKQVTWKDVLDRDYHSWSSQRVLIDTSGKTVADSLAELEKHLP